MPKKSSPLPYLLAALLLAAGLLTAGCSEPSEELVLYGNVDIREVELGFRVGGRLAAMHFEEGDTVETGELVAEIDGEPYAETIALAEAQVAEARARLALLERGSRPQEIEQAQARVREAEAAHEQARRDFARQEGLVETGASSEKALERARALRDETAARLSSAREALALVREGFRSEDIAAGRAALAAAEARLEQARTQLDDTRLLSPSDGIVIARIHEPGSMLGAGTPVYSLSLVEPVYVRAYVAEPQLGRAAPGKEVWVTTDSSGRRYRGQIGFVSPRAEFTPRSVETPELRTDLVYRLRIVVTESDDRLRQGMPVTVHFEKPAEKNAGES